MCCRLKHFLEKYVRKIQDANNLANLEISHRYRKNPVSCSACTVNQKIKHGCFSLNGLISRDLLIRISRSLAEKYSTMRIRGLSIIFFKFNRVNLWKLKKISNSESNEIHLLKVHDKIFNRSSFSY